MSIHVEVVVSTYNNPKALDLTLCALRLQVLPSEVEKFTICVADDGSGQATQAVISTWQAGALAGALRHVWQADDGFQKNRILNQAIATSSAHYLIFLDGDCIASNGFVARHMELAKPKQFVTGGLIRLRDAANAVLNQNLVESGEIFKAPWLAQYCNYSSIGNKLKSLACGKTISDLFERISPVKRTWNGCNASGWRSDILFVNGFNEDMRYGSEDVELGVRLNHSGVVARHCRYTAPVLHMDHARSYAHQDEMQANRAWVKALRKTSVSWTEHGIEKMKTRL